MKRVFSTPAMFYVGAVFAAAPAGLRARPPEIDLIDAFLATPAQGFSWEMPVVIIRYLPTVDDVMVDATVADWSSTLADLKARIDQFNLEVKFMLEEGSRFRGYANPSERASLGYRVLQIITVYEPIPADLNPNHGTGTAGVYFPDYAQILTRFDAQHWVNDMGVKEFWVWGYHHGSIVPVESNMSSPTTGDVSNSNRFQDDLPVYDHTYTLYNYNFTRSSNEAVHNHGHQLEAILSHVNQLQDGDTDLFWKKFVGQNQSGAFTVGRCGWTHMPPNTTNHYDYYNPTLVSSDIEDWTPTGVGNHRLVNVDTWGTLTYAWPYGRVPEDLAQHQWYVYWMQNMPGRGNTIAHGAERMTNWWTFTGDWDASASAVTQSWGLYGPAPKYEAIWSSVDGGVQPVHADVFEAGPARRYELTGSVGQPDAGCLLGDPTGAPPQQRSAQIAGGFMGAFTCESYGDVREPYCLVDLDDLLCVLEGFAQLEICPLGDIDPCGGSGLIDVDDLIAMLDAFAGIFRCPTSCSS